MTAESPVLAGCPAEPAPVSLRKAAGLVNRCVRVDVAVEQAGLVRVSKRAAREMLAGLRRLGKRTIMAADPFGDGRLMLG